MYDNLFEPLSVGPMTLSNRLVRTAHATGIAWDDNPAELIAYHQARAIGGVSMSILQTGGVHPSSVPTGIPVYTDDVIVGYKNLVAAIRPHGMKLIQQLQHHGTSRVRHALGGPPWSASDVPNPMYGVVPHPMAAGEIQEVVDGFAAAARRAKLGGLDGVEVHAAHGYLIGQFLSAATNLRDDEYGGSMENRKRLLVRVLERVRAEVGEDFVVGVRLSADDEMADGAGSKPSEALSVARSIEDLVDYVNVSLGSYYHYYKIFGLMDEPLGYELPKSEILTKAVGVPTIVSGRIMTLDHASQVVRAGQADMVSMVRALMADPDLINKARNGKESEVRPCISSNQGCIAGLHAEGRIACVVNPSVGRETSVPSEVAPTGGPTKRVVIVGGGPAGLEAARTAKLRGHEVILLEMTRRLGGQVEIAAKAPHRSDYAAITRWLADEIRRLGVKVRMGTPADPDLILELAPDVVVVATGSTPRRDGFQTARPSHRLDGIGLPHVYTSWDLFGFGGRAQVGSRALVYDDTGGYEALSAAEQLSSTGAKVTLVTRHEFAGANVKTPLVTTLPIRERLANSKVGVVPDSYLVRITSDQVEVGSLLANARQSFSTDTVIFVGHNYPNVELADAIDGCGFEVIRVGDAWSAEVGGQGLQAAIHESRRLLSNV
ncbi:oxidoreductase [Rhodococcus wratislaviensis]|uniref:Putative NADH-dependent oxidoreductase n=1 Tax=Rhodococcus wratislaviensis NBRC 100605 TaxID=1219028 RepID=X0Q7S1_RHOWR|nr:FAD-dependent oxidoreductase [Rhodococcus wratislaviensis]GAF47462.1 putative NADH-dependent oxidoreductase [Rhodococcus wratislaviensis NBRC 100605]